MNFAQQTDFQRLSAWHTEADAVLGYQRFIANGGDYDTLSPEQVDKLTYQALANYYGPNLPHENFARNHLLALSAYRKKDLTDAVDYVYLALKWANKINNDYCRAAAFRLLADFYYRKGQYDSALHYQIQALVQYQQLNNPTLVGVMMYQIGNLYYDASDYPHALSYLGDFIKADRRHNIKNTLDAYDRIGRIYQYLGKYDLAIGYFEQVATLAQLYNRPQWFSVAKGNVGKTYLLKGKYQEAIPLLETSYFSALKSQDTTLAMVENCALVETYLHLKQPRRATELLERVRHFHLASLKPEAQIAYWHCQYYYEKSIGNFRNALAAYEKYIQLEDSVKNFRAQKQLEQVYTLSRTALQKVENKLNKEKAEAFEDKRNIFLFGSSLLAVFAIFTLFFLVRLNRRLANTNKELKRSEAEIRTKNQLLEKQNQQIAQQTSTLEQLVKERTRELEATIKVLNSRNKDLEQFSYILSHNIRSPIAQIMGLVNLLNFLPTGDPSYKEILFNLQRATNHLDQVIKDLNIIISTRQNFDAIKEKVDMENLIRQVIQGLEANITEAQAVIQYDFSLVPVLYTIKSYLHSILHNLISNAIKYRSEARPCIVAVSADLIDNFCCINVADNGLGIDLEKIDAYKIFGLYQRMHTHVEGKGLGLYMVKTQVESLGGTISVESTPAVGTLFRVMLPL
ncbi:MAG: tetratricopeptide repeat-containing sensor histidine kinase [Bernardetiaceae bacterium]|nr:tetratricopeptide repeat-containing sensor histidine kinase [Bernardetiaceae bacterium]